MSEEAGQEKAGQQEAGQEEVAPEEVAREDRIKQAWEKGDFDGAATRFLTERGAEILGFLVSRVGDQVDARDVFSEFCEDYWRGLPGFEWRCSMRGWAYTLARHAADRYLRAPQRKRARNLTLPSDSRCSKVILELRTATLLHKKTEVKDRVQALRERLPEDDRMLLTLRVDRALSWEELTLVMAPEGKELSEAEIKTESARLRKRFQRVKDRLRELAQEEGLLQAR